MEDDISKYISEAKKNAERLQRFEELMIKYQKGEIKIHELIELKATAQYYEQVLKLNDIKNMLDKD